MKENLLKIINLSILNLFSIFIRKIDNLYTRFYIKLCPIKRTKIVFDNFGGKGYGDNPKYIAEEIIRQGKKWDMVWVVWDLNEEFPPQIRKVLYRSNAAAREWASAKIWIDNVRDTTRPRKKKGQIYLQTWHGTILVKKVEMDAEDKLDHQYLAEAKYDGSITDGIISHDSHITEMYKRAFWLNDNTQILEVGSPKEVVLFDADEIKSRRKLMREKFNITEDEYIVLYAPTFREGNRLDAYQIDFNVIRKCFEKKMKKKCKVIIRLHPNIRKLCTFIDYNDELINGSLVSDFVDLAILSDCVITDVSSCFCEFLLQDKPAFLCVLDEERYRKERGIYKEYWDYPLKMAKSTTELELMLNNTDFDDYKKCMRNYLEKNPIFVSKETNAVIVEWLMKKGNIKL